MFATLNEYDVVNPGFEILKQSKFQSVHQCFKNRHKRQPAIKHADNFILQTTNGLEILQT